MKTKKIYRLKTACVALKRLKTNERKYKKALVKRACTLIKTAISRDLLEDAATVYDRIGDTQREWVDNKLDWSNGFWKTFLGKWVKSFYDRDKDHLDALALYLTSNNDFRNDPALMRNYLNEYGITDKATQDDLISKAQALITGSDDIIMQSAQGIKNNRKLNAYRKYDEHNKALADSIRELHELGVDVEGSRRYSDFDDRDSGPWGGGRYGHRPSFYRDSYLTDHHLSLHPGLAADIYSGIGRGGTTTINNYYNTPGGPVASATTNPLPGLPTTPPGPIADPAATDPPISLPTLTDPADPAASSTRAKIMNPLEEGVDYAADLIATFKPDWAETFKDKTMGVAKRMGDVVEKHPEETKLITDWFRGNVGRRPTKAIQIMNTTPRK